MSRTKCRAAALAILALAPTGHALTLQLDFSYDAANGNFFGQVPAAKSAVIAAAADLSTAITENLSAVTRDVFTGTNGSTTATFDWFAAFENPATGAPVTLNTFTIPADTLTVYVGMRPLSGSTLGEGGPGRAGFSLNGTGFPSEWAGALALAEAASNDVMPRDGGPIMGSLSGSASLGAASANYTVAYGALLGDLRLDNDSDNNGIPDALATLAGYWHYDHTTTVEAGKRDFYSVALHEMVHVLGFGTSETWDTLVAGTNWLGPEAQALNGGSGANLIAADGGHIAEDFLSTRISDGVSQEVAMDPTLLLGTRKSLTVMDLAFLRDLGYATVPEPSSALLAWCGIALLARRR